MKYKVNDIFLWQGKLNDICAVVEVNHEYFKYIHLTHKEYEKVIKLQVFKDSTIYSKSKILGRKSKLIKLFYL